MYAYEALRLLVDEVILVVGSDTQLQAYKSSLHISARIHVDVYRGGAHPSSAL